MKAETRTSHLDHKDMRWGRRAAGQFQTGITLALPYKPRTSHFQIFSCEKVLAEFNHRVIVLISFIVVPVVLFVIYS